FPALHGSLHWTRKLLDIWDAGSRLYGGGAQFAFSIKPLGNDDVHPTARFDATYTGVNLAQFSDFETWPGLRFAGAASGHNVLEWPTGQFKERRGEGHLVVSPPIGVEAMTASTLDRVAASAS